jgi:hypothetical protein
LAYFQRIELWDLHGIFDVDYTNNDPRRGRAGCELVGACGFRT